MSYLKWASEHAARTAGMSARERYLPLAAEAASLCGPDPRALKMDAFNEANGRKPISGLYPRATLIEIDEATAERARARCPWLTVVTGDVRALPFDDGAFDLALDFSTLDHLPSRHEVLRALTEYRRVLSPGGVALVISWATTTAFEIGGRSGYGGTQAFWPLQWLRDEMAARFELLDCRIITPTNLDRSTLALGGGPATAEIAAFTGRRS